MVGSRITRNYGRRSRKRYRYSTTMSKRRAPTRHERNKTLHQRSRLLRRRTKEPRLEDGRCIVDSSPEARASLLATYAGLVRAGPDDGSDRFTLLCGEQAELPMPGKPDLATALADPMWPICYCSVFGCAVVPYHTVVRFSDSTVALLLANRVTKHSACRSCTFAWARSECSINRLLSYSMHSSDPFLLVFYLNRGVTRVTGSTDIYILFGG